jgi:hypothetical protein
MLSRELAQLVVLVIREQLDQGLHVRRVHMIRRPGVQPALTVRRRIVVLQETRSRTA